MGEKRGKKVDVCSMTLVVSLKKKEKHKVDVYSDFFVFNDTIEGPRAPAVKPGHIAQP